VQGGVNSDNITLRNEFLEVFNTACTNGLGSGFRQGCIIVIEELLRIEGLQAL
jgi:hypothetical protein